MHILQIDMRGGRLDQRHLDYITIRLANIRNLINQCMVILEPLYANSNADPEEDLSAAERLTIENNTMIIDTNMEEIAQKYREIARRPGGSSFTSLDFAKVIRKTKKIYMELYEQLYGGYNYYDVDVGVAPYVVRFRDHMNSIHLA